MSQDIQCLVGGREEALEQLEAGARRYKETVNRLQQRIIQLEAENAVLKALYELERSEQQAGRLSIENNLGGLKSRINGLELQV